MVETHAIAGKRTKKVMKDFQSDIWPCISRRPLARIPFAPIYKPYLARNLFVIVVDNIQFCYYTTIILLYIISTLYICFIFPFSTLIRIAQLNMFFTIVRLVSLKYTKHRFLSRQILVWL